MNSSFQEPSTDSITQTNYENYVRVLAMVRLSAREQEVLTLLMKEGRLKPVAEALGLSINTVRNQRRTLMKKLGAKNAVELTLLAIRKGLIEP